MIKKAPTAQDVLASVKAGRTFKETALLLGMTRNQVAGICYRAGLKFSNRERGARVARGMKASGRPPGRPPKAERNAEILAAAEAGLWTQEDIGREFGVTGQRVSQIVLRERMRSST